MMNVTFNPIIRMELWLFFLMTGGDNIWNLKKKSAPEKVPRWCWISLPFIGTALIAGFLFSSCVNDSQFVCHNCSSRWSHHHQRLDLYKGRQWIGAVDYR